MAGRARLAQAAGDGHGLAQRRGCSSAANPGDRGEGKRKVVRGAPPPSRADEVPRLGSDGEDEDEKFLFFFFWQTRGVMFISGTGLLRWANQKRRR